jgi:hypothetical protein
MPNRDAVTGEYVSDEYAEQHPDTTVHETDPADVHSDDAMLSAEPTWELNPLNGLAAEIHDTAVSKGWWDEERSAAEVLVNIHGEVSEAWEDWRVGREQMTFMVRSDIYPREVAEEVGTAYRTFVAWADAQSRAEDVGDLPEGVMDLLVQYGVAQPVGMEVEVVDVIIRCLDMLAARGTDIDKVMRTKMNYNRTRAYRHGGKKA